MNGYGGAIFALTALLGAASSGCREGVPLVGLDRSGRSVESAIRYQRFMNVMPVQIAASESAMIESLNAMPSDERGMPVSFVGLGFGVEGEVGFSPLISVSGELGITLIFEPKEE
jgi:hypothetical protein